MSKFPDTPPVPALKGTNWPDGFKPGEDVIEMKRTIRVSQHTRVTAKLTSAPGGEATVETKVYGTRPDSIPIDDVGPTVIAMNILKEWVAGEQARLVIEPLPPEEQAAEEVEDLAEEAEG